MVWLSKREVAYLLLLRKVFVDRFNLGEALDILELFGPRRVARKVIKRLVSKGFIRRLGNLDYNIRDLEESLWNLLLDYLSQRLQRNLRSRGIDASVRRDDSGRIVVEVCGDTRILEALFRLNGKLFIVKEVC
ncbi:MAG TPA: hypothetical protein EYH02_06210 [Ignisphaera aggregans]|uniref:Uncharacterized protein n=1 Tax=Ignisphaera aggregans TaxID=334771 RepID=A0A833DU53_9CREN|nr:hypothetical protein [Ignisphaera aggregans]